MTTTLADPYFALNAGRRYPLADDTTGLADAVLLDFRCSVRGVPAGLFPQATLARISDETTNAGSVRRVTVSLTAGDTALGTLDFDFPTTMASSPYTAVAASGTTRGTMTASPAVLSATPNDYAIPFARTTVIADTLKVDSLTSADGVDDETLPPSVLTGPIVLAPGYNTDPYLDGNRLRLDIFKGAGIGEKCTDEIPEGSQTCANVLFTINGERPGSDGEIKIVGDSGITVIPHPEAYELEIRIDETASDTLSQTCENPCGGN